MGKKSKRKSIAKVGTGGKQAKLEAGEPEKKITKAKMSKKQTKSDAKAVQTNKNTESTKNKKEQYKKVKGTLKAKAEAANKGPEQKKESGNIEKQLILPSDLARTLSKKKRQKIKAKLIKMREAGNTEDVYELVKKLIEEKPASNVDKGEKVVKVKVLKRKKRKGKKSATK